MPVLRKIATTLLYVINTSGLLVQPDWLNIKIFCKFTFEYKKNQTALLKTQSKSLCFHYSPSLLSCSVEPVKIFRLHASNYMIDEYLFRNVPKYVTFWQSYANYL